MRALISEKENVNFLTKYVGTHDNVYRHVAHKQASAGGGIIRTLNNEPLELSIKLKVIYKTEAMMPHPIASHPRVPVAMQVKLSKAIMKLTNSKSGRKDVKSHKNSQTKICRSHQRLQTVGTTKHIKIRYYTINSDIASCYQDL